MNDLVFELNGKHKRITVTEATGIRYLHLDECEEGAMALSDERPVFHYLWGYKLSGLAKPDIHRALVLGAGAFTAAKCLALDHPRAVIDTVDREPELEAVARRFFRLGDAAFRNIRFFGEPAESFLSKDHDPYDFVFDDLFDGYQHVSIGSDTWEHVHRLKEITHPGAICIKNVIWSSMNSKTRRACEELWLKWKAAFAHTSTLAFGPIDQGHNRLLIGGDSPNGARLGKIREELAHAGVQTATVPANP
jgi:spermidine synthase